ncbi:DUF1932 domain-containing protein [Pseudomonadota bacterium]
MKKISLGILHPGEMGISVAASAQDTQHAIFWASVGRSQETIERANNYQLNDAKDISGLCLKCEIIISVCPPEVADEVANQVIAENFSGLYLDANAISPQRSRHIGKRMAAASINYVDGGIIGPPAWSPETTVLYLAGKDAEEVVPLFAKGALEAQIVSEKIGDASALKMCFAAYTKGSTALLCSILASAEKQGVRDALNKHWSRNGSSFATQAANRVLGVTAKAWRFVAEMEEISSTFEAAGVPGVSQSTAAEIYRRLAHFKNAKSTPELEQVLCALIELETTPTPR